MDKNTWVEETMGDYYKMRYKTNAHLFSGQSNFQKVDVYETVGHGKMLLNDNLVMVSERDEFVYHDMISHIPLFTHPNPQRVLVIGGGDGGTAREVLRHKSVKECVMVEIDEMVVSACKEFIPQTSVSFKNPKLNLLIEDGVKYVKDAGLRGEKFDVIIVDSCDPIGPSAPLFGNEFYKDVHHLLNDDGIVVSQGESPYYQADNQLGLLKVLNEEFEKVFIYNFSNLTYPGGFWSFTFASKKLHPVKDFNKNRVLDSGLEFSYYNEEIHTSSFSLPEFQRKVVKKFLKE